MPSPFTPGFAVVFDFDGTILDTETPAYESHCRFFGEHGVALAIDEWCTGIGIVQAETHWFEWLCARAAVPPSYERFREATHRYYRERVRMEPMPGILALLDELDGYRIPRAVGSTAPAAWVVASLDELSLTERFTAIVTGDQVRRGKPAPDVYLEAAHRMRFDPRRCVAIEDSGPGLASARAAGMRTIAIPHPLNRTHDLAGADMYAASARDVNVTRLRALLAT